MGVFSGLTFCVSGAFSISQSAMTELIIKNGGHIASTASKKCSYVVSDQLGSGKTQKAVKDNIPVVNEAWVQQSVKQGKLSTNKAQFLSGGGAGGNSGDSNGSKAASKGKKRSKDEDEEEEGEEEEEAPTKSRKAAKSSKSDTPSSKGGKKGSANGSSGSSVFAGLTFCVSGAFSISQGDMKKLIENNGGKIAPTVNKSVTHVVASDIGSSKTVKAEEEGTPIVSEDWVQDSIKNGALSTDGSLFLANGPEGGDDDDGGEGEDGDECGDGEPFVIPEGTKCLHCPKDLSGIVMKQNFLKCPDCKTETYGPHNPAMDDECCDEENDLPATAFTYGMFYSDSWDMDEEDPKHEKEPYYWPLFMIGSPNSSTLGGQDRAEIYRWMDDRFITWRDGMEGHHYLYEFPRKGKSVTDEPENYKQWTEAVKSLQQYMEKLGVKPASEKVLAATEEECGFKRIRL